MLRPHHALSLVLLVMAASHHAQSRVIQRRNHEQENIDKMAQLRERYDEINPVTFPPVSPEDEAFLKSIAQETVDERNHIPSIVEINGDRAANLIEGDIVPSDSDIVEMEERLREAESGIHRKLTDRSKRAASNINSTNWPTDKPISFGIANGYSDAEEQLIRDTLATFKENTCIEFEEDQSGTRIQLAYYDGGACESEVGRIEKKDGFTQAISLGRGGCVSINTIQHETMHALGFDHTQSRADRNEYVEFFPQYVKKGDEKNFDILPHEHFDNHTVPYEFNSVMHYPITAFSKDEATPVLLPWKRKYVRSVGGSHGATFNDWKQINIRYKCSDKCPSSITCLNNGYQHPRACDSCACPKFFTGNNCEREVNAVQLMDDESHSEVYENAEARSEIKKILDFSTFDKKLRVIKAPEGRRIRIILDRIESDCACSYAAVEIVDEDLSLVGKRFCCNKDSAITFVSKTNVVGYQAYSTSGVAFASRVTFAATDDPPTSEDEYFTTATSTPESTQSDQTEAPETGGGETSEGGEESTDDTGTDDSAGPEEPEDPETSDGDKVTEESTSDDHMDETTTTDSVTEGNTVPGTTAVSEITIEASSVHPSEQGVTEFVHEGVEDPETSDNEAADGHEPHPEDPEDTDGTEEGGEHTPHEPTEEETEGGEVPEHPEHPDDTEQPAQGPANEEEIDDVEDAGNDDEPSEHENPDESNDNFEHEEGSVIDEGQPDEDPESGPEPDEGFEE